MWVPKQKNVQKPWGLHLYSWICCCCVVCMIIMDGLCELCVVRAVGRKLSGLAALFCLNAFFNNGINMHEDAFSCLYRRQSTIWTLSSVWVNCTGVIVAVLIAQCYPFNIQNSETKKTNLLHLWGTLWLIGKLNQKSIKGLMDKNEINNFFFLRQKRQQQPKTHSSFPLDFSLSLSKNQCLKGVKIWPWSAAIFVPSSLVEWCPS